MSSGKIYAFVIAILITFSMIPSFGFKYSDKENNNLYESTMHRQYPVWRIKNMDTFEDTTPNYKTDTGLKIVFDEGHGQYYDSSKLQLYLSLLETVATVEVNEDSITQDDLADADLLIMSKPAVNGSGGSVVPEANLTVDEIDAIRSFLNSGGGLLLIGEYHNYFDPSPFNAITARYGIVWYDADAFDNESNYDDRNYYLRVTNFPENDIAAAMEIQTRGVGAIFFSGTVLNITDPENVSEIYSGPYPIVMGMNSTYYEFQNDTVVLSGNRTILVAAVELSSGGRIVASGSSRMFSDTGIVEDDTMVFTLLVTSWLLNISPDDLLRPILKGAPEEVDFYPGLERNISINILNPSSSPQGPIAIRLNIPYFVSIVDNVLYITNTSGTYALHYEYNSILTIGNISGKETITVEIPLRGDLGLEKQGILTITLYVDGLKIMSNDITILMHPAISVYVMFDKKYVNITRDNTVTITINVTNVFPSSMEGGGDYIIHGIDVAIFFNPSESISPSNHSYTIDALDNYLSYFDARSITFEILEPELFEITVVVRASWANYEGNTVSRPGEVVIRDVIIATTEKIIIFDEGHNQYYRFSSEYMQGLIQILRNYGPILINEGGFILDTLKSEVTSLIIIPNPEPENNVVFSDEELSHLKSYIENGGNIILMGNWYRYFWPDAKNGYNDLTRDYGIFWYDGDVYDPVNYIDAIYSVKVMNFGDNDVARHLTTGVDYVRFAGTGLNLTSPTGNISVEHYPILIGNNETYLTLGAPTDEPIVSGPDVIMASVTIVNNKGKIFACGSSYMFSDYYYFEENKVFIENIILWIFGAKKLDVQVSSKSFGYVGETISINVSIINRGTVYIENISLQVLVLDVGLEYINDTTLYTKDVLGPGEMISFVLLFRANKAGEYNVEIIVTAKDYPEEFDYIIPLIFEEKPAPIGIIMIGVAVLVAIVIVVLYIKKRGKLRVE